MERRTFETRLSGHGSKFFNIQKRWVVGSDLRELLLKEALKVCCVGRKKHDAVYVTDNVHPLSSESRGN